MIGDVAHSRWTLRFRDPALERAYRDDLALQLRTQVTVILVIISAVWLAAGTFDGEIAGSPGNARVIGILRWVFAVPIVLATWWHGRAPVTSYLRWRRLVVSIATVSMTVMWVCTATLIPDPELSPVAAGVQSWILGTFAITLLFGIEFALIIPINVAATTIGSIVTVLRFPQLTPSDSSNTLFGVVLAFLGTFMLEGARRRSFVASARADRLLENVLPTSIADRLKQGERRIAEQFDEATVLFADLVGFTAIAEKLPPGELVDTLDDVFSTFDDLAARHGLEKIKTIGDAYMVVGGVPTRRADHAHAVAAMALEMRDAVAARGDALQLRIGIHTGPVIAGVIGKRKFIYDLWGDTVNLASRMESHGVPGAIQVSGATAAALEGAFVLEPRGPIAIKGKADQPAFLLSGRVAA